MFHQKRLFLNFLQYLKNYLWIFPSTMCTMILFAPSKQSLNCCFLAKKRFKLTRTCTCVSNASSIDWCVLSTWLVETRIRQEKNGRIVIAIYPDNQHVSNFDLLLTCNRQIFHNSLRCWLVVIQNTLKLHTCTSFSEIKAPSLYFRTLLREPAHFVTIAKRFLK